MSGKCLPFVRFQAIIQINVDLLNLSEIWIKVAFNCGKNAHGNVACTIPTISLETRCVYQKIYSHLYKQAIYNLIMNTSALMHATFNNSSSKPTFELYILIFKQFFYCCLWKWDIWFHSWLALGLKLFLRVSAWGWWSEFSENLASKLR